MATRENRPDQIDFSALPIPRGGESSRHRPTATEKIAIAQEKSLAPMRRPALTDSTRVLSLQCVVPIILAVIGVVLSSLLAFFQLRAAHYRLKYDLFDRRLKVYRAAITLKDDIDVGTNPGAYNQWLRRTEEAEFIFPAEFKVLLDEFSKAASSVIDNSKKLKDASNTNDHGELSKEDQKLRDALREVDKRLTARFKRFLNLNSLRGLVL